ncbi:MAG: LicD family protein [Rikenellaceae bacterium]|nr:LicD family protein [Rikenellaceae bacterium]
MTDLKHLQDVILMIAKDMDELCKKNDIKYFLLGGSAIGAIRHKGFIPWDDDLDIVMDNENYEKFIKACRSDLDTGKYYIQEAFVNWPLGFTKIKLKGTFFQEPGLYVNADKECGIFLDVFKLENAPSSKIAQGWQYLCAKYLLCYCLLERGWKEVSVYKKILMFAAYPVKFGFIRKFLKNQVEKWNKRETDYRLFWTGRYRYNKSFYAKDLFEEAIYVPFEDTKLPVPKKYNQWLTQIFGDYMTPPPIKERIGLHLQGVDFGKY